MQKYSFKKEIFIHPCKQKIFRGYIAAGHIAMYWQIIFISLSKNIILISLEKNIFLSYVKKIVFWSHLNKLFVDITWKSMLISLEKMYHDLTWKNIFDLTWRKEKNYLTWKKPLCWSLHSHPVSCPQLRGLDRPEKSQFCEDCDHMNIFDVLVVVV